MRINSCLWRSRHGGFYYRHIVPVHLRPALGCNEIKRSLHTKDPAKALMYAHYIALSLSSSSKDLLKLLSLDKASMPNLDYWEKWMSQYKDIRGWVLKSEGFELSADPGDPKDLEAAEQLAIKLFANKTVHSASANILQPQGERLSQVYPRWVERILQDIPTRKTTDEYLAKFGVFKDHVGDVVVHEISSKMVSEFVTCLASGKVGGTPKSPSTINKYITSLHSFLNHVEREGLWPQGRKLPTEKQRVKRSRKNKVSSYQQFTNGELSKIFDPHSLLEWDNPHMHWLPLLALYSGARIEELCQLNVTDIYQDDEGIHVLDINDEDSKQLKTAAAIRKVPLHPALLQLGLLDYVNDVRTHFPKQHQLFPYLTANKYGKLGDAPSKWFGRYLDKIGIQDAQKVFHSFRSTANDTLKRAGVSEETRCQMVGHEYGSVNSSNYSKAHSPSWLLKHVIPKLEYPDIELSGLKYSKGHYVGRLAQLLKGKQSKLNHRTARSSIKLKNL